MLQFIQTVDNNSKVVLKCWSGVLEFEITLCAWLILSYLAVSSDNKLNCTVYNEACISVKLCLDGHEVEKINV